MAWFEGEFTLQTYLQDFEKLLNENDWQTYAKFRVKKPGDQTVTGSYADVRLFKSLGSDKQLRYFGIVSAYGNRPKETAIDFISKNSILGKLAGEVNGNNLVFKFIVYPIKDASATVFKRVDGVDDVIPSEDYTIDYENGVLTFNPGKAPSDCTLHATYEPSDEAPGTVKKVCLFTFEDVKFAKPYYDVQIGIGDDESVLEPNPDGVNRVFTIKSSFGIKLDSVTLYKNGVIVPAVEYDIDYPNKRIIIRDKNPNTNDPIPAPSANDVLRIAFTKQVPSVAGGYDMGDVIAESSFDPNEPSEVMDAVYRSCTFIYPSLPTVMSFTPLVDFTKGWQRDSSIFYWGNINKDRIIMFFRPDPTPGPENCFFTPLYIGKLTTIGRAPKKNMVIISGAKTGDTIMWSANKKLGPYYVDYGPNTCNGNDGVQLQQSIGGTYYQRHYLAFITHDKQVDEGESRFNPSVYSGKYHISPMCVVHPNDGFVGKLDDVFAIHPKNIFQLDTLEIDDESTNEVLGTGDGVTKVFHLDYGPSLTNEGIPFKLIVKVDCQETEDYTLDPELKTITFNEPPPMGAEILADYAYKHQYVYTLADTPETPYQKSAISPFAPIGIGILKERLVKNV